MNLIAVSGKMGSGKDAIAGILGNYSYWRTGFADALRGEIGRAIATDYPKGTPYEAIFKSQCPLEIRKCLKRARHVDIYRKPTVPYMRKLLQWWGIWRRETKGVDYWVEKAFHGLADGKSYVFSDCRFANEAQAVKDRGGEVWRVVGRGYGSDSHISEQLDFPYDKLIDNSGSLEGLKKQVEQALCLDQKQESRSLRRKLAISGSRSRTSKRRSTRSTTLSAARPGSTTE